MLRDGINFPTVVSGRKTGEIPQYVVRGVVHAHAHAVPASTKIYNKVAPTNHQFTIVFREGHSEEVDSDSTSQGRPKKLTNSYRVSLFLIN